MHNGSEWVLTVPGPFLTVPGVFLTVPIHFLTVPMGHIFIFILQKYGIVMKNKRK